MDTIRSLDLIASFRAPACMDNWEHFNAFIETQAGLNLGPGKQNYNLRLACEEIISNVIRHAGDVDPPRPVSLELRSLVSSLGGRRCDLIIELIDDGPFFDPCFDQERRIDKDLEAADRPIGGLGLFLVQQSVDHAGYLWADGSNCYRLTVHLDPSLAT